MKKSICVDARMINHSGIGVYIQEILKCLTIDFNLILLVAHEQISNIEILKLNARIITVKSKIYTIKEQIEIPLKIPKCDIFWCPHYNAPIFPTRAKKKISTIHDIYHLRHSQNINLIQKFYSKIIFFFTIKNSQVIITVSEFSKNEILLFYPKIQNKIKVIHNGIEHLKTKIVIESKIDYEYLLYVGNVKPHKNLKTLIEAFNLIKIKHSQLKLVIIGKKDGFINGEKYIQNSQEDIIFTGHIDNVKLVEYYKNAKIFIFPSIYEGFGFPPLEAMIFSCPTICSNAASIPEICEDATLYFNPYNCLELISQIETLLTNPKKTIELKQKGLIQANKFSWIKSYNIHKSIFEK